MCGCLVSHREMELFPRHSLEGQVRRSLDVSVFATCLVPLHGSVQRIRIPSARPLSFFSCSENGRSSGAILFHTRFDVDLFLRILVPLWMPT